MAGWCTLHEQSKKLERENPGKARFQDRELHMNLWIGPLWEKGILVVVVCAWCS